MSERPEREYRARYHARWVLPVSSAPIEHGTVVVEHDRIVFVGPRAAAPPARDVELGEAMITPGLVNAHTHLDLTVLRGRIPNGTFFEWIRALVAARNALSPDELLESARTGVRDGLHAGITTFADTAPSDAPFEAMREAGVRGIAYREVFGPDPAECDASLAALKDVVEAMRERETHLVQVGVSPHAPYSVSDELYRKVAEYARASGLRLATHVAESEDESRLVARAEGDFAAFLRGRTIVVEPRARSPVELLERCDVLGERTLLIHCVRVDARDIETMATHRCGVATCPMSNATLGHGRAPVHAMLDAGIPIGVGSDSMASNDVMNVFWEASSALRIRAGLWHAPDQQPLWQLATIGGARALGLERDIGTLEVGKQADIAAFPLHPGFGRVFEAHETLIAPVVPRSRRGMMRASLVVVAGRVLLRDAR